MAGELAQNPWGVIVRPKDDILELRWLPSTASMSDGGFMATLCLFAWEAERARPLGLLIDAVEFRHQFGAGVMEWRDAAWFPERGEGSRRGAGHLPHAVVRRPTAGFRLAGRALSGLRVLAEGT